MDVHIDADAFEGKWQKKTRGWSMHNIRAFKSRYRTLRDCRARKRWVWCWRERSKQRTHCRIDAKRTNGSSKNAKSQCLETTMPQKLCDRSIDPRINDHINHDVVRPERSQQNDHAG